jgi:uncharacterized protein YndB with AHSA1/START domain
METQTIKELTLTRVLNAPRELVWKVWTDPEHLIHWWGPKDFTNKIHKLEVKPGGTILIDMIGPPNQTVYPMTGAYTELKKPERLVFTSGALDANGKQLFEVLTTVTFTEENGKTKVTMHAAVETATPEAAPHIGGMDQGWNESLDRLVDYVNKLK